MAKGLILPPGQVLPPLRNAEEDCRLKHVQSDPGAVVSRTTTQSPRKPAPYVTSGKGPSRHAGDRFLVLNQFVDGAMAGVKDRDTKAWLVLYRDTKPNGLATASNGDIAKRMGCSLSTAKRALRRLRQQGFLEVVRRGGPTSGANAYRVHGTAVGIARTRSGSSVPGRPGPNPPRLATEVRSSAEPRVGSEDGVFSGHLGEPHPIRDPITACLRADAHARGQNNKQ